MDERARIHGKVATWMVTEGSSCRKRQKRTQIAVLIGIWKCVLSLKLFVGKRQRVDEDTGKGGGQANQANGLPDTYGVCTRQYKKCQNNTLTAWGTLRKFQNLELAVEQRNGEEEVLIRNRQASVKIQRQLFSAGRYHGQYRKEFEAEMCSTGDRYCVQFVHLRRF